MIIRIQRSERTHPFVLIDKRPLEDSRLSWKAKGLLAHILAKPDSWSVRPQQLAKCSPCGVKAVRSAMQELASCGYAHLRQIRSADGKRALGSTWVVGEVSKVENGRKVPKKLRSPKGETQLFRHSAFQTLTKPARISNNIPEVINEGGVRNPTPVASLENWIKTLAGLFPSRLLALMEEIKIKIRRSRSEAAKAEWKMRLAAVEDKLFGGHIEDAAPSSAKVATACDGPTEIEIAEGARYLVAIGKENLLTDRQKQFLKTAQINSTVCRP